MIRGRNRRELVLHCFRAQLFPVLFEKLGRFRCSRQSLSALYSVYARDGEAFLRRTGCKL